MAGLQALASADFSVSREARLLQDRKCGLAAVKGACDSLVLEDTKQRICPEEASLIRNRHQGAGFFVETKKPELFIAPADAHYEIVKQRFG
ncbi:MAG: hypothetical protein AB9873_08845 [Syntrophobacteraceae bacterium]